MKEQYDVQPQSHRPMRSYRGTRSGFQRAAKRGPQPTAGLGDPNLVHVPKPRVKKKPHPLQRLRDWEQQNGGHFE